jgi:hypothetical protein
MTRTTPDAPLVTHSPRLGIVHLLGWTLGVAVVLGIYRAGNAFQIQDSESQPMSPWALGFGLAYGTALGGLSLFLWRWWRGTGSGPIQPGHWLLVFAGLGFCLDLVAMAAADAIVYLWTGASDVFRTWNLHQCLGWSLGAMVALVVLSRLRDASVGWIVVAALLFVTMSLAAIQHIVSFAAAEAGALGNWTWQVPLVGKTIGVSIVLAAIIVAEIVDRRRGRARDWLHAGGILAVTLLSLAELTANVRFLLLI